MSEHPIEGLMTTAMDSIREMIDVNTIIGEPIETSNNIIIIPISKVGFGFAAGGSEFNGETIDEYKKREKEEEIQYRLPFGGGSGAGVSITPVAFLIVSPGNVKLLPVDHSSCIDRLLDYVPDLVDKANNLINKQMANKKEEKKQEVQRKEREKKEERREEKLREAVERVNNAQRETEERLNNIEKESEDNKVVENKTTINKIVIPNTRKLHPKRNKTEEYKIEYNEPDGIDEYDDDYED